MTNPNLIFFEHFASVWGAFGVAEAYALFRTIVEEAPSDKNYCCVEFGSHKGKAASAFAYALKDNKKADVLFLVDPLYEMDTVDWSRTNLGSKEVMKNTYQYVDENTYVSEVVQAVSKHSSHQLFYLIGKLSVDFLKESTMPIGIAHIDSDPHEYNMIKEEMSLLEPLLIENALLFFHDYKNQFKDPAKVVDELVASGKYELIEMHWEEAEAFVKEYDLEKKNNSFHDAGRHLACVRYKGKDSW